MTLSLKESVYIYGHSTETRSYISDDLIAKHSSYVQFIEIKEIEKNIIINTSSKLNILFKK